MGVGAGAGAGVGVDVGAGVGAGGCGCGCRYGCRCRYNQAQRRECVMAEAMFTTCTLDPFSCKLSSYSRKSVIYFSTSTRKAVFTIPSATTEGSGKQPCGSILSWEQLVSETSKTLGTDEVDCMLADVSAPFHFSTVSPALSTLPLECSRASLP